MPEIYDPLNLIELDPVMLSAAQEERVAAKKKGGASSSKAPSEPKETKKQKEVVAAMESTPQELPPPPSPEDGWGSSPARSCASHARRKMKIGAYRHWRTRSASCISSGDLGKVDFWRSSGCRRVRGFTSLRNMREVTV